MRHQKSGNSLSRDTDHRKSLRKNLIKQLFEHERIRTTRAKAMVVRGPAEKLITLAKRGNSATEEDNLAYGVHARRLAVARLGDKEIVSKLFDEIAPRYTERNGGYTRVIKLAPRMGDAADMVLLELVE
jgi:large subunit ribosomal protein L17